MKLAVALLLLTTLLVLFSGYVKAADGSEEAREPKCESYESKRCPRIYSPVCGNDGISYDNECKLCVENMEKKRHVRIIKDGKC
ncbi:serine protease inhibitor Kazal-type 1 [Bombina bombina]|uniref:serine protease inhibitor Kazal-type 1 n=1 Tax=Bombina bombina TaxID=8345 RepID=UPI00235AA186|nr:serine protease inhibitor Kazal-type 1 [Bombina bombina]